MRPSARLLPRLVTHAVPLTAWALFLLLTIGPVVGLLIQAAGHLGAGESEAWALILPSTRRLMLLAKSVSLSLSVAMITGALGGLTALGFQRWAARRGLSKTPGLLASAVLTGLIVWVIMPPYLHGLVGVEAGSALRSLLRAAGGQMGLTPGLPGWLSVFLVQCFALLPVTLIAALIGILTVERDLIEAAALFHPETQVFRRIMLPLAAPAILIGMQLVFVLSLLDSNTPSLFGTASYAMEIVAEYSASHTPWRAALLALPLIVVTGCVIGTGLMTLRHLRPTHSRHITQGLSPLSVLVWPARLALLIGLGYASMILLLLLGSVMLWSMLPELIWEVRRDIWLTLSNAVIAGGLTVGPAAIIAWSLTSPPQHTTIRAAMWGAVLFPLALPPALTGVGIATFLSCCAPDTLRLSAQIPALAHVARFLPLAVLAILVILRRLDPLLIDAARLSCPPGPRRWRQIEGPLTMPALMMAFGLVFAGSIGELEATLMIAPPGGGVLSMRIFNYLHYGASETVAALGLILVITIWLGISGALAIVMRHNREDL